MKKHAIIPVFIPHMGCPNSCVFCNQKQITARQNPVTAADVESILKTWLSTLEPMGIPTIETAFYGGSFTGIPMEDQSTYLSIAKKYKDAGRIDKIHLSTRPDYITPEILDNLRRFDVDTIELGVQSFDDKVLQQSDRGHDSKAVYSACRLIHDYGFELGVQLMIGLPGDSLESCIFSAKEAVRMNPSIARLYPTVVLEDTRLYEMSLCGSYTPLAEQEAVLRTKEMYKILDSAGINIIRVGLKNTDLINKDGNLLPETYHPAFRQLVEGDIAREQIVEILQSLGFSPCSEYPSAREMPLIKADFFANGKSFSNLVGHQGRNKKFFLEKYPRLNILYKVDNNLKNNQFQVKIK